MPLQTVEEVLKAARAVIANPEHWTKTYLAVSKRKKPVSVLSEHAACFCSAGALAKVVLQGRELSPQVNHGGPESNLFFNQREAYDLYINAIAALEAEIPRWQGRLASFNDTNDHAKVISIFDKAIHKRAKQHEVAQNSPA